MPLIIGWFIGKFIGTLIVSIITLLIKAAYYVLVGAWYVIKYTYIAMEWLFRKLWLCGKDLYEHYKLNLQ